MPKIFQKFDLERARMPEDRFGLLERLETLRDELITKGYDYLESNSHWCGFPTHIILGGEFGMHHKDDFCELANRLDLATYKSAEFYTQRLLKGAVSRA